MSDYFRVQSQQAAAAAAAARADVLNDSVGLSRNRYDGSNRNVRQRTGVFFPLPGGAGGSVNVPLPGYGSNQAAGAA